MDPAEQVLQRYCEGVGEGGAPPRYAERFTSSCRATGGNADGRLQSGWSDEFFLVQLNVWIPFGSKMLAFLDEPTVCAKAVTFPRGAARVFFSSHVPHFAHNDDAFGSIEYRFVAVVPKNMISGAQVLARAALREFFH